MGIGVTDRPGQDPNITAKQLVDVSSSVVEWECFGPKR